MDRLPRLGVLNARVNRFIAAPLFAEGAYRRAVTRAETVADCLRESWVWI